MANEVVSMKKQFEPVITPNSITFYFQDDRMPNPGHLARRLLSIRFNRENNQCMEYIGHYEFWNSENHLKRLLEDIHYLRSYCKKRGLFLKEIVFNSPMRKYLEVLAQFARANNGFLTQTWKLISPKKSIIIGHNLEFLNDNDIGGSD